MMQTCSNCGATSREGAKFCTTCGSRLNPVTDPTVNGWGSAPTNDPAPAAHNIAPPEEPATGTGNLTADPVTENPSGTTTTSDDSLTPSWSWGQTVADPPGEEADTASSSASDTSPEPDNAPTLSSWAMQWDTPVSESSSDPEEALAGIDESDTATDEVSDESAATHDEAIADAEESAAESDEAIADAEESAAASDEVRADAEESTANADEAIADAEESAAAVDELNTEVEEYSEEIIALPAAEPERDVDTPSPVIASTATAEPATEEPSEAVESTVTAGAPTAPFAFPSFAEATAQSKLPTQDRAHELLNALRILIDDQASALARMPEPEPAPVISDQSANTQEALATLQAVPSDGNRFENLRAILERAREHPRDVDTMLDLLGEINGLIALIDSHETYVQAVKTAVDQLENA